MGEICCCRRRQSASVRGTHALNRPNRPALGSLWRHASVNLGVGRAFTPSASGSGDAGGRGRVSTRTPPLQPRGRKEYAPAADNSSLTIMPCYIRLVGQGLGPRRGNRVNRRQQMLGMALAIVAAGLALAALAAGPGGATARTRGGVTMRLPPVPMTGFTVPRPRADDRSW